MELINKDYIKSNKKDIKTFFKKNKELFPQGFYTELYNINLEHKVIKGTVEAMIQKNGFTSVKDIRTLYKEEVHSELGILFDFMEEYLKYALKSNKNMDLEYELATKYWDMMSKYDKKNVNNYNEWVIHLLKHTYKNMKGWTIK